MPWGRRLIANPRGDHASDAVKAFFAAYQHRFDHFFVSWQPRSRARLQARDYFDAWDDLFSAIDPRLTAGLHHTALNLAASSRYSRKALLPFTNALIRRYNLRWVNEDLGFWSLGGRPLPYPLPPLLTDDGLAVCIRNCRACNADLEAPLLVEFPGFSEGYSLTKGGWDAYDFFREVVEQSGTACTLDTGHLLSWRWRQGHRGDALLQDLDRLPLEHCFEVHLSGVGIRGDAFYDAHDGRLIREQLVLLAELQRRCPNLRLVTFEDPVFEAAGALDPPSNISLAALERVYAA
jgi:uncharacterized protein (UPF0276 family)